TGVRHGQSLEITARREAFDLRSELGDLATAAVLWMISNVGRPSVLRRGRTARWPMQLVSTGRSELASARTISWRLTVRTSQRLRTTRVQSCGGKVFRWLTSR